MMTRLRSAGPQLRPRVEYGRARPPPNRAMLRYAVMIGGAGASEPAALLRAVPTARRGGVGVLAAFSLCLASACGSAGEAAEPEAGAGRAGAPVAELPTVPAAAPPSTGDTPSGADAPVSQLESGDYAAMYAVPVAAELEPYATFYVDSVRFERGSSELRLSYELPELLLGEHRRLSFRGTLGAAGRYVLEGDDGVATCSLGQVSLFCDEVLRDVEPDAEALERLLVGMPAEEASARRAVAERFSIDPIGVLSISFER